MRELHGTLEIEAGEGGGKCSGGTVRTSEAMEMGFDLPVLQPKEGQTKGAATGINRRLRVAGSHIVPLRVLSVSDTGGPGGGPI